MKLSFIFFFVCLFLVSCTSEKDVFENASKEKSEYLLQSYIDEYPNGEFVEDAYYMICSVNSYKLENDIVYLQKYPHGKYSQDIKVKYGSIWNTINKNYDSIKKENEFSRGVLFTKKMFKWMQEHYITEINVDFTSSIKMKDYTDYPEDVKSRTEALFRSRGATADDYISYKRHGKKDIDYAFNHIDPIFSKFVPHGTLQLNHNSDNKNVPTVYISCMVHPLESASGVPEIWDTYDSNGNLSCFVMSLILDYNVKITIPETKDIYNCAGSINPHKFDTFPTLDERTSTPNGILLACVEDMLDIISKDLGVKNTKK